MLFPVLAHVASKHDPSSAPVEALGAQLLKPSVAVYPAPIGVTAHMSVSKRAPVASKAAVLRLHDEVRSSM